MLLGIVIGIIIACAVLFIASKVSAVKDVYKWQERQDEFQNKLLAKWELANHWQKKQAKAMEKLAGAKGEKIELYLDD